MTVNDLKEQQDTVKVLNKGYVRLVNHMGTDASVVDAARVSWDKECEPLPDGSLSARDHGLIAFLVREHHTSPFRHGILSLECYAPLMVKNQWIKHLIGMTHSDIPYPGLDPYFAWNESSRRYVTENEEFYIPSEWRGKPANNKQGSDGTVSELYGAYLSSALRGNIERGLYDYREAMDAGVAPEQARLFLPANALYVRWRWTSSLQGVMHFIQLRDESHAQWEIQEYARAVKELARTKFPVCIGGLDG